MDKTAKNCIGLRTLTPRECARLQGFPDDFKIPVSNTQAYRQFGNTVSVPVVNAIANRIKKHLTELQVPKQVEKNIQISSSHHSIAFLIS